MPEEAKIIKEANDRLMQKRKDLQGSQTGNLTPLTLKSTLRTIEEKRAINPTCDKCGNPLYRVYSKKQDDFVLLCYGDTCKEERQEKKRQELLEMKRKHPEKFMTKYNVPKKYLCCSLDTFKGNSKVVTICKDYAAKPEGSLVFSGVCGCGKTHLAASILREMVKANAVEKAIFVTAPELLLKIRQSISASSDSSISEVSIIDKFSSVDLLILDDLGAEKTSPWAISTLYLIIDRRNREERLTIYTTNLTLEQIEKQLNARIASRLSDCKVIKINMPDFRKKR